MPDRNAIAELVIKRRESAKSIPFERVTLKGGPGQANWSPQPNQCHDNVRFWLSQKPNDKAVTGYLLSELSPGHWEIYSHSVVEREDGSLIDITPMHGSQHYPFVRHEGTVEEFDAMKGHEGIKVSTDDT